MFLLYFSAIVAAILFAMFVSRQRVETFVSVQKLNASVTSKVDCLRASECTAECLRFVQDEFVTPRDAERLLSVAQKVFAQVAPSGPAAIFDLISGAVSHREKFVNAYELVQFSRSEFELLLQTQERILHRARLLFGSDALHLTSPMFFARLSAQPSAKTLHDEYWHEHVDTIAYGSFAVTGLLYLSTHGESFDGGRFLFLDDNTNRTLAPRAGRLSMFSSGHENVHRVERVTRGDRFALTIAFTCDDAKRAEIPFQHFEQQQ